MRMLYIHKGDAPDYQCDMILHGGREFLGEAFIDARKSWFMYKTRRHELRKIYGKGFTIYGLLEDTGIDRSCIREKILDKYYDIVIYGSVHRDLSFWREVSSTYKPSEIIFIDGEDHTFLRDDIVGKGIYFKRELVYKSELVHPVNFCIPERLIVSDIPPKERMLATVVPGDRGTYIYERQEDYYKDYRESYFGLTMKKGGWDCCRHYEILLNGCIPMFPGLEQCPGQTMTFFPKKLVLESNRLLDSFCSDEYWEYNTLLLEHTRRYLTTKAVFQYILSFAL